MSAMRVARRRQRLADAASIARRSQKPVSISAFRSWTVMSTAHRQRVLTFVCGLCLAAAVVGSALAGRHPAAFGFFALACLASALFATELTSGARLPLFAVGLVAASLSLSLTIAA